MKLAAGAVGGLVACALLVLLSQSIRSRVDGEPAFASPAATAPADGPTSPSREQVAAQGMSGLLLMFAMVALILSVVCAGWLVWNVYQSQPAWKRQKKYPQKR